MADEEFYDENGEPIQSPGIRAEMKRLRAEAKAAQTANAELAAAKRDLAFAKAGVPEDGIGALLRKAYDGEPTPEAVKAFAAENGIPGFSQPAPEPTFEESPELQELKRAANVLGSGGESIVDPEAAFKSELAAAQSPDEVAMVIEKYSTAVGVYLNNGAQ